MTAIFGGSGKRLLVVYASIMYPALGGMLLCAVLRLVGARWRDEIRTIIKFLSHLFLSAFVLLMGLLIGGELTFQWLKETG